MKWYLKDIIQDKDIKVFSCFSCGGGSSMGYKKAGFKVVGNVEIDPQMNKLYLKNHHPEHNYQMDLRDFNDLEKLPEVLYGLDILDGSPPCSTFSMAGDRERSWNKEKQFREGQKKQRLDDLFFVFLETVEKLKPKVVVAENVKGLIMKNARGYCHEIIKRFRELGYEVQMFCLNSAQMDVPQARERVFFIANNQKFPALRLEFDSRPIRFGEVRSEKGVEISEGSMLKKRLQGMRPTDRSVKDILTRTCTDRQTNFGSRIVHDNEICCTIASSGSYIRGADKMLFSDEDFRNVQTFPQDYDFMDATPHYVCGMSVPPNMMEHVALELWKQWFKKGQPEGCPD